MAQTSLMPPIKTQFLDNNGNPASGGKVYTWMAGTNNTAKATYTDSTGATENANPVTLDANGRAAIWLSGYYHIQAYDSAGNLIADVDNVSSMPNTALTQSQWVSQNIVLTYIDADQFSTPGVLTSTFATGQRVKVTVSAGDLYGTVSTSTSGGTPVVTTVTVTWDSGQLDSGLSALWTGVITPTSCALPGGATGADLAKLHTVTSSAAEINLLDDATPTPAASKAAIRDANAIVKGAELNMTGEAEAHEHDASTSLDLGSVTAGDRILVSAYVSATADSGLTTAVLAFGKTSGTAAIKFFNDLDNIGLYGFVSGGAAANAGGTFVAEVTTSGTLVLVSSASIPGGTNTAITTYIYAVFLKKA